MTVHTEPIELPLLDSHPRRGAWRTAFHRLPSKLVVTARLTTPDPIRGLALSRALRKPRGCLRLHVGDGTIPCSWLGIHAKQPGTFHVGFSLGARGRHLFDPSSPLRVSLDLDGIAYDIASPLRSELARALGGQRERNDDEKRRNA